ncbi:hypothetical protein A3747_20885 [Sulfitobacter sp. HI0076]|jgi:hypothetical protein|nr:hypothetical protein A3720_00390 [Sulfitobacter sp. HI0021]KZY00436.1 hypothetical protein A3722_10835 [Sulfitobacter sp. HI0027]KZZ00787.1 hypothetical protein A3747_20885 [Sulfitobacter sp. HI0076]
MEISSTRGGILAESTHETKTTTHVFEHIIFTSDNVNLLDIMAKDRARRFLCYFLEQSAAMV